MTIDRRGRLLLLGLLVAGVALAAWGLRGFVRQVIAVPLLYFYWITRLYLQSVPQVFLWVIVLVIAFLLAAKSLGATRRPIRIAPVAREAPIGPVEAEMGWIRLAARSGYGKWRLAQRLAELAADVLAHRRGITPGQVRKQLRVGELDAPPEIRAYMKAGLGPIPSIPLGCLLGPWARPQPRADFHATDLDPERAVEFLEDRLEVQRDHGDQ